MPQSPRPVPIVLLGPGGVGRALLRQIAANRTRHAAELGLRLCVRAVADASGAVVAGPDRQLDDEAIEALIAHKASGGALAGWTAAGGRRGGALEVASVGGRAVDDIAGTTDVGAVDVEAPVRSIAELLEAADVPGLVIVDCTASADVAGPLVAALRRGHGVVLANKLPLAGDLATWDAFDAAGRAVPGAGRARWEATVGAAVPIIATLRRLLNAGDDVASIEGTFSGSLNFLATELRTGRAFSEVVRDARSRGFTEPDPRADLGGLDLARKALILARMLGARIELADVAREPLYPLAMADLDVAAFMDGLEALDAGFAKAVAGAGEQGGVWRYAASVTPEGASVGPVVAPADSPLGLLRGTDNHVAFHTRWYAASPLVLQGRGAGVEATASGVLSDVVEVAVEGNSEGRSRTRRTPPPTSGVSTGR